MRDRNLVTIIVGLNVALAATFVIYLVLSNQTNPAVVTKSFADAKLAVEGDAPGGLPADKVGVADAGSPAETLNVTNSEPTVPPNAAVAATNEPPVKPVFGNKQFGWRDVEADAYRTYLDSLAAVGCPPDKVRYIVLSDIDALMDQKRLQASVEHDLQWWKSEPSPTMIGLLQTKGRELEEERRSLIARWLGEEAVPEETTESVFWNNVQLTGPVLGKLNKDDHQQVQQICAESMDRYQSIFWSNVNAGQPVNQIDLAQLREGTRSALVKVLAPEAIEEFLLRYSHNANRLRQELSGLDPTPQEFRKAFSATDALDHATQLEFGGPEAMSPQQRERYERRRDGLIRDALGAERYEAFLMTKDPLYRQAQLLARQYGAPSTAIKSIYEMSKQHETRRKAIMEDASLSPQDKQRAIQTAYQEQQQSIRQLALDAAKKL